MLYLSIAIVAYLIAYLIILVPGDIGYYVFGGNVLGLATYEYSICPTVSGYVFLPARIVDSFLRGSCWAEMREDRIYSYDPEFAKLIPRMKRVATLGGHLARDSKNEIKVYLVGRDIHDSDLSKLESLESISQLWLGDTHITDVGLDYIANHFALKYLDVRNTPISVEAVDRFQARYPKCIVYRPEDED